MGQKRGDGKQRFKKRGGGGKLGKGGGRVDLSKVGLEPPYKLCPQFLHCISSF